jgi:hypothetical protein
MTLLDTQQFTSPAAEYRPVPIWFWNGDLDEEELHRQVQAMADGGLGGFQIAARTGLTTPYLSGRWFALVEAATREAQRHGLHVWLADEYPYPSGTSGGELTLRSPEYRAWHMKASTVSVQAGHRIESLAPGTILLYAAAAPTVEGKVDWTRVIDLRGDVGVIQPEPVFVEPAFGLSNKRTFSFGPRPKLCWTAPSGPVSPDSWEVWLVAAAEVTPYKFFGYYVDLCNPDAVRAFLETTYQRYADRLDSTTLRQITGFFLDEAHPPTWSWRLPGAFLQRTGYDLVPVLPALWTDIGPRTAQVRYDYWQTVTTLFIESFHRPVAEWCRSHDLQLTLEVDSPRNLVQRYADVGGNDPGHEKVGTPLEEIRTPPRPRYRANPRFAASLAAQVGQRRVLDESFHSVGWSLTLQDMKAMVDRLAAQGANFFVFHAFFYTLGGLRKWDAPPSQFLQNPYWPYFSRFADYAGRLCYALSRGRRVAPIALVDPITSLWTHGGVATGVAGPGPGPDAVAARIATDWQYLLRELEAAQRQFDTLDPLLLAEGTVEHGALRLGEATYQVIVLPPMASLEAAAWTKLEEFAASGGTVVACGLLPYEQIEPGSDVVVRCAARFDADPALLHHAYEHGANGGPVEILRSGPFTLLRTAGTLIQTQAAEALLDVLDSLVPADLVLLPADAAARRSFLVAQRQDADETLYFIANASGDEIACDVAIRPAGIGASQADAIIVEQLDLEDGSRHALSGTAVADADGVARHSVSLQFSRYGSHVLLVRSNLNANEFGPARPAPAPRDTITVDIPLEGAWHCSLDRDNALRFDRFRFGVVLHSSAADDTPPASCDGWPLVEPKPLVNLLRDLDPTGLNWPVPVQVETPFGSPARLGLRLPVTAWYVAEFDVETLPERVVLCAEMPAFHGEWAVWINDQSVPDDAFQPRVRWDITNREADVRSLLRTGRNQLAVRVTVQEQTDGLVDALYLLGDFGVGIATSGLPTLGSLPRHVRWDHLHADGLPYYAGAIHLTTQVDFPAVQHAGPDGLVTVRLPDDALMYLGVAELTLNGHHLGPRTWAPYRWQVPARMLRSAGNEVTVTVTTTLIGLLEGKRYDPIRRTVVRAAQ